jgi:DNA-3-methyladenine glycosylase
VKVALPRSFYQPTARLVAPRLLGHFLVCNTAEGSGGGAIVETEAYLTDDPASHGYAGQTERNRSMYGPPGRAYVYFIYGNYFCVNAVCRPSGCAEAILIRAIEVAWGEAWMRQNRKVSDPYQLTNGPAKLCAALKIDRKLDGADLCDIHSPLYIATNPDREAFLTERGPMITSTRVGISRAADWPLRFYLKESRWVSRKAKGE